MSPILREWPPQPERYIRILQRMGVEVYAADPAMMRQMGPCRNEAGPWEPDAVVEAQEFARLPILTPTGSRANTCLLSALFRRRPSWSIPWIFTL